MKVDRDRVCSAYRLILKDVRDPKCALIVNSTFLKPTELLHFYCLIRTASDIATNQVTYGLELLLNPRNTWPD